MRTEFDRLLIRNSRSIEEADVPLRNQGLVLIRGENLDEGGSNGSGKSSIFETLSHIFFGKTTKSGSKASLLRRHDPKNYFGHCQFTRDDSVYFVDQFRNLKGKGTGFEIYKDKYLDESHKITRDGYNAAQQQAAELLNCTWSEFLGRIDLSQRYSHTMIQGTPKQKQQYISRYFGLEVLDEMLDLTSKRQSATSISDLSSTEDMLAHITDELSSFGDLEENKSALRKEQTEAKALQKQLVSLLLERKEQEALRDLLPEKLKWQEKVGSLDPARLKKKAKAYQSRIWEIKEEISTLDRISRLKSEIADCGIETDSSYEEVAAELERLDRIVEKLSAKLPGLERRSVLEGKLSALAEVEVDAGTLQKRSQSLQNKLSAVDSDMLLLKSEVKKLSSISEDECPTCLRPIEKGELSGLLAPRKKALSDLEIRHDKLLHKAEKVSKELRIALKREELEAELTECIEGDLNALKSRISSSKSKMKELASLRTQLFKLSNLRSKLQELEAPEEDAATLHSMLAEAEEKHTLFDRACAWSYANSHVEFDESAYNLLISEIEDLESKIEATNNEILKLQDCLNKYEVLSEQKEDLEKSLAKHAKEKNRQQALHYISVTLKDLKKIGLKDSTEMLTQVLPFYLTQLFPKGSVKLRVTDSDGFDLLFEKGGALIPLSELSGGQEKRVGVAIIFAFASMGARTSNLLIADEPFDSLDPEGRQCCYELLRTLDVETILITSHDSDLKASKKYDQTWTMRMENHKSRLFLDG